MSDIGAELLGHKDRLSSEHVCVACVVWITSRNSRPLFGPGAGRPAAPWHRYGVPMARAARHLHIAADCSDERVCYPPRAICYRCFSKRICNRRAVVALWIYCFCYCNFILRFFSVSCQLFVARVPSVALYLCSYPFSFQWTDVTIFASPVSN